MKIVLKFFLSFFGISMVQTSCPFDTTCQQATGVSFCSPFLPSANYYCYNAQFFPGELDSNLKEYFSNFTVIAEAMGIFDLNYNNASCLNFFKEVNCLQLFNEVTPPCENGIIELPCYSDCMNGITADCGISLVESEVYCNYFNISFAAEGDTNCYNLGGTIKNNKSNYNAVNAGLLSAIIVPPIFVFILVIAIAVIIILKKYKKNPSDKSVIEVEEFPTTSAFNIIKKIDIYERLGGGTFGDVYRGLWLGTEVALKKLKEKEQYEEFIKESFVLRSLQHPNIVQFFGIHISSNDDYYIVTEYFSKGSLDNLLRDQKDNIFLLDLLSMAKDTAAGMLYLGEKNIIHRDLALRNLLVGSGTDKSRFTIKISDFGMSKITSEEYYKTQNKSIPIKWCPPEVIEYGKFSVQSDIWAFGVTMWEIFTYAKAPYYGTSNMEAAKEVIKGYRLEIPEACPKEIYKLMNDCWNVNVTERPSFEVLFQSIESIWLSEYNKKLKNSNDLQNNESNYTLTDSSIFIK